MSYKTKLIDLTGCNPIIADHLRRGMAIECWVWDDRYEERLREFVVGYGTEPPYIYRTEDDEWGNAEPIETKFRVKNPVDLMRALVEGGWEVDRQGNWVREGCHPSFTSSMWRHCGEPVEDNEYHWDESWIEEK
jgi:hypothetical protein